MVDGTVEDSETYFPHGLDSFVALARLQSSYGSHQLRDWPSDCPHAYKTIELRTESSGASYICFLNNANNAPYKSRILPQPFASRRAPANWGRVVKSLQFVAIKLLYLAADALAGDVYCAENANVAQSGSGPLNSCAALSASTRPTKRANNRRPG